MTKAACSIPSNCSYENQVPHRALSPLDSRTTAHSRELLGGYHMQKWCGMGFFACLFLLDEAFYY